MSTPPTATPRALTPEQTTAAWNAVANPAAAPSGAAASRWLIAELTDGRVTGHQHPGHPWVLSSIVDPTGPDLPGPDAGDAWRLLTLRIFDDGQELLLRRTGPDTVHGWVHTDPPPTADSDSLATRTRGLLIGTPTTTATPLTHGFVRLESPTGNRLVLPGPWQLPERTDGRTTGTWLTIREYFTATPIGVVGITRHRYAGLTTGTNPAERTTP